MARLGELGIIITGNTPKTSEPENYSSDDICFVKPSDFSDGQVTIIDNSEFHISEHARKKARILPPGSVFVTCIGVIGRVAINNRECSCNQQINVIIPDREKCCAKYLAYAILSRQRQLQDIANAPVVPIINKSQFSDIELPLPALPQQKYMSAVLDKVSDLIDQYKRQLSKLDDLVKSRFVEMFGDPANNSKHYPTKPLSSIAEYWNGLTYKPEDVVKDGTIVLRSSNIRNGQLDYTDLVRVGCKIPSKKFVEKNDILMCSRNGSAKLVGKVALIDQSAEQMAFGAFMMIVRSAYYPYLFTYFQLPAFRQQIQTGATTTINQITVNMLNNVVIPVPDNETINQFAAFAAQVDKSKSAVQSALDKAQLLFDSLMQKYFG